MLFNFEKYGNNYTVTKSEHCSKKRKDAVFSRDYHYTNEKLFEIFDLAIGQMTQFRDKGNIAVSFKDDKGKTSSLLCSLEGNYIVIITMLYGVKSQVNNTFLGSNNIFLKDYVFTPPSSRERDDDRELHIKEIDPKNVKPLRGLRKARGSKNIKKVFKAEIKEMENEDEVFLRSMKNIKGLK